MSVEFSYRIHHSYKDYLAQQYLRENMEVILAKNVRSAVGSVEDICRQNATEIKGSIEDATDRLSSHLKDIRSSLDTQNKNLEVISFGIDQISGSLDVLNSNVVNGFQALFVQVAELNASLAHISRSIDSLVEIARTPVQTWAFNQYDISRDAMRRGLFPEALDAVNLAINGNGQQTGYRTDFRFHQLRGVLLLGIPGEPESILLVDLKGAEEAFLLAERYANRDHKVEAAQAMVGAGKAAYADGRLPDAHRHFTAALGLHPQCAEAHYQLARLCVHGNVLDAMRHFLCTSFNIHWSFAIRAAADGEFALHYRLVEECVRITADQIAQSIIPAISDAQSKLRLLEHNQDESARIDSWADFPFIKREVEALSSVVKRGMLKSAFEARSKVPSMLPKLKAVADSYCSMLRAQGGQIATRGTMDTPTAPSFVDPHRVANKLATTVVTILGIGAVAILAIKIALETAARHPATAVQFVFEAVLVFAGMLIFVGLGLVIGLPAVFAVVRIATLGILKANQGVVTARVSLERRHTQLTNEKLVAQNQTALNKRLAQIEAIFLPHGRG
jgi:hypothetical protein